MTNGTRIATFSRKESFSSAHRLNSIHFNAEQNKNIYGKCNHVNSHGHNYELKVTIMGEIDPCTGMCFDLAVLKKEIKSRVLDLVDHKNLDLDVEFFKSTPR
ncbi:putative 6-pyruvoyl tetrahydrobiopterin synthase [Smittium culicis]|uniref:6-pyruvoyl tetrahydrobiopterin synthase n=1 Tax=Smittium culicis TaxID=133412 RepID=A0A1R1XL85_9FUNG|nr:putative 6-pyruvoyl tetrahydrobiopterin synthase [Smittium culicis]